MAVARKPTPKPAAAPVAPAIPVQAPFAAPASIAPPAPQAIEAPAPAEFPGVVLAQFRDAQENFRKAAEQSFASVRDAYAKAKAEAEAATGSIETSFSATRDGLQALNAKAIEAIEDQTKAGFDHAKALLGAKDVQDFIKLQSEFARSRFEAFTAHSKEIAGHLQKVVADSVEPLKTVVARNAA